jgi:cytoskeleton protein RodZ
MDDNIDQPAPGVAGQQETSQQPGAGAVLRDAREQAGLSVADVVERIKFAPKQIEALEAEDYESLPQGGFLRGFVRSYARLLQLSDAELLARLPQPESHTKPTPVQNTLEAPMPHPNAARRANLIWLGAALLAAIGLAVFTLMPHSAPTAPEPQPTVEPAPQTQVQEVPLALPPESAPASAPAAVSVPVSAPQAVSAPVAVVNPVSTVRPASAPVASHAAPASVALPAAPKAQSPTGAAEEAPVRMVFDQASWAEVRDRSGKPVFSKLSPRGSEQKISGQPPFRIVIGHAQGVHLYYRGKEVDLVPHTRVEVARLTLE